MSPLSGRAASIIPLVILGAALVLRLAFAPSIEEYQLKSFDVMQRLSPRPYVPAPVRFVDIDDESLKRLGQWPWPRTRVAELLAHIANAGGAAIALDMVFAEPDRTSPSQVLPLWPATPEVENLRGKVNKLPDHDTILANAMAQMNVVTGFILTTEANKTPVIRKAAVAETGDSVLPFLQNYAGAVVNLPRLVKAAAGNGAFTLIPSRDGIIRRVPLLFAHGKTIHPSLTAEVLRIAQGASTYVVKASGASGESAFGGKSGLNHIKIGAIAVPTDAIGRLWLHYTKPVPARRVPAWRLFQGDFDKTRVANTIVVVGTSAAGLKDTRATPLTPGLPGALIHVEALEQMLTGYFLQRPDWTLGAELVYVLVLGGLLIVLIARAGAIWGAGFGISGIILALGFSWYAFSSLKLLIDPVFPILLVLAVYLAATLFSFLRTEGEKRQVRGAFAQYLSPALVEQLAAEPGRLKLGGEMKEMTLLFADIRGFTTISEQFKNDPQGLTALINRFLTPMTDMILARRGTIDKYMGDCIMAFWNAPLEDLEHARHGADSALAMFTALEDLNAEIKSERKAAGELYFPLDIGIGLNSGEACVGNMGSDQRFDYSVLGDTVNLAARLEGQSKNYGVGIVIGEDTQAGIPDYASLELDLIAVKGKVLAVRIFALLGPSDLAQDPRFGQLKTRHNDMLAAYRAQAWEDAETALTECRDLDDILEKPLDLFYDLYADRISEYQASPPGPDWDGVFVATSK